jgi:hypothetical protein
VDLLAETDFTLSLDKIWRSSAYTPERKKEFLTQVNLRTIPAHCLGMRGADPPGRL